MAMTVDGQLYTIQAKNQADAISKIVNNFDPYDEDDLLDSINFVEWEENGLFICQNMATGKKEENKQRKLIKYEEIPNTTWGFDSDNESPDKTPD